MDTRDINLRHFFALEDIADAGRLSTAAERVYMSQSALTQALRKLEDAAGVTLFERAGFGVSETKAGAMMVRRARRAIELMAQVERMIRTKHPKMTISAPLYRQVTASQLRALVAVVETGGYSLAARRLGLAQPTVHRAAKDLEAVLGISLFQRAARGVEPGEVAKLLARYAELVFAEVRQGFEELWEQQGQTNSRVAVGCLPLVRSGFLPATVTQLLSKYPDARVSILDGPYSEQLHALRYGQIDWLIGALRDPPPTTDIVQQALFEQPLAIVVRPGHPLLKTGSPAIDQLARLEWVAPRPMAPARKFFDEFFERNGVRTPTRIIECSSLIATRGLLQQSDRAALLSPMQVREDVTAGELAVLVDAIPDSSRSIGMTVRDYWEPTMVQAEFANIVRNLAAEISC
ncbi:MAG: LysR family transcriptional regulator [Gammaproteobacteria bacterium]|jgi:DNA-binding transcriptional LysR family regulator|nr:LysR family transcriptional regulator [Gammaproteobacteria bacterium]